MSSDPFAQPVVNSGGRCLADHLVDHFLASTGEQISAMENWARSLVKPLIEIGQAMGNLLTYASKLPPSPGYEPLLVQGGHNRVLSRGIAHLLVRFAKRSARESKQSGPVHEAIRFLGERARQRRAILPRAKLLLKAWEETSVVDAAFCDAGADKSEFIQLLRSILEGKDIDLPRLTEIAGAVASHLSLRRGPKISAPSAAHEMFLLDFKELPISRRVRRATNRAADYADAVTEATRREFNVPHFDQRSVRRRLARSQVKNTKVQ